ncbi:hypothetical protein [Chromobacterium vaccinii]|uniref:hypothetical protein n=1 Tax=Chromobacterium vaccinii TaxID=1108595 RepID=UPI0031D55F45
MSESLYGEPLLAEVYDLFNAWGEDNDFYLGLCSPAVGSALDLGCGTGLLAAKMAERAEDSEELILTLVRDGDQPVLG